MLKRRLKEPFGKAGLIVACLALVAALGGTALAASKLNSTQKKEVEKISKKFAGKPGTNGTNGGAGPTGATGPAGTAGGAGAAGKEGPQGKEGSTGKEGKQGKEGSPWTAGGTLPEGKTETGTWAIGETNAEVQQAPISFTIPLEKTIEPSQTHFITHGTAPTTECPTAEVGGFRQEPEAAPGNICVYESFNEFEAGGEVHFDGFHSPQLKESTGTAGVFLWFLTKGHAFASGTWAVTAPEA